VIICNHLCRSVQCLDSQSLAPLAAHDDGCLDLLLVNPVSAPNLLRFLLLMQFGAHIDLPFVEYYKVRRIWSPHPPFLCGIVQGVVLTGHDTVKE